MSSIFSMGLVRKDLAAFHNDDFKTLGIKVSKKYKIEILT